MTIATLRLGDVSAVTVLQATKDSSATAMTHVNMTPLVMVIVVLVDVVVVVVGVGNGGQIVLLDPIHWCEIPKDTLYWHN